MSGIAGIVNLDGAPADRELLDRMAFFLGYRGPDATTVWASGSVGLVHTLLRTTPESAREQQPASLDGAVWITADARLDGRDDLIAEFRARGRDCAFGSTEPELLLHAYAVWGERCVEHLLGDFAFAIWDGRERKVFCARDHFGVKPFFYAQLGEALVFSNAIDCPRLHPDFRWEIRELAIADFLILGYNHDVTRTSMEAIRRLAPAHVLIARDGAVRTRRYWSLPVDPPTVFRHSRDYVERFRELFEQAVSDRLRTGRVAVLMSGGMDSTSVAATAKKVLTEQGLAFEISSHTCTYGSLVPYDEDRYARLAADALRIPWRSFPLDDQKVFALWDQPSFRRAEPEKSPLLSFRFADILGSPPDGLVVLTGQGGDGIFSCFRKEHCRRLAKHGRWWQLTKDVTRYLSSEGRLRRLHVLGYLRALWQKPPRRTPFPPWLSPDFERRLALRDRYQQYGSTPAGVAPPPDAVRPEAHETMSLPQWPSILEDYDADHTGAAVEFRHPFFDLRLVRYVLSLPALPWCTDKELLRRSMRGLLPDQVRLRKKQHVATDYLSAHYHVSPKRWLRNGEVADGIERYLDLEIVRQYLSDPFPRDLIVHLRPICLNYWLQWESRLANRFKEESSNVRAC